MANLYAAVPDLLATHADWTEKAATFEAFAEPPAVSLPVSASAAAVAAIHAQVAEGHIQFGKRLAETAARVQSAAMMYMVADEEHAARISEAGGDDLR